MKASQSIELAAGGGKGATSSLLTPEEVLTKRLDAVTDAFAKLPTTENGSTEDPNTITPLVHRLRVTTRRADAAIQVLGSLAKPTRRKSVRRWLRAVRKQAGVLRSSQVDAQTLIDLRQAGVPANRAAALDVAILLCNRDVACESDRFCAELSCNDIQTPRTKIKRFLRSWDRGHSKVESPSKWSWFLAERLPPAITEVRDLASRIDGSVDALHQFRIGLKKLRYTLEIFTPSLGGGESQVNSLLQSLKHLQAGLGSINDLAGLTERLRQYVQMARKVDLPAESPSQSADQLESLQDWINEQFEHKLADFKLHWSSESQALLDTLSTLETHCHKLNQLPPTLNPPASSETDHHTGADSLDHQSAVQPAEHNGATAPTAPSLRVSRPENSFDNKRLAALDIGTNSIRLVIAEMRPDGTYRVLDDEKETTRLGSGLILTGKLSQSAMDQAIEAVKRMKAIADGYGVTWFRGVGTCAVREAANSREFVKRLKRQAGVDLEVISAETEARLAHLSVSTAFDLRSIDAAVVDIGGGSTEIVLSSRGVIERVYSLMLGAVGLTEQHRLADDDGDGVPAKRYRRMRAQVREELEKLIGKPPLAPQTVFGTGGTFTALAAVALHRSHESDDDAEERVLNVRGYDLTRPTLKHLLHWLRGMSSQERARVHGLSAERADIIVAGAAIVDAVLARLGSNSIRVHDRGIRDGLLLEMIRQQAPPRLRGLHQIESVDPVRTFARACNYEEAHSEHVTMLGLQVFDQLAEQTGDAWMTPVVRRLFEAAAVLHDVGYYINYAKHHKHSYHLILHSELPGFTHREIAVIAHVARYHRRAAPRQSHPSFAALPKKDQTLVRRLAAILRVVDGLDRAHAQHVRSVDVALRSGQILFKAHSKFEPTVDLWGAQRKCKLFENALNRTVQFTWIRQPEQLQVIKPAAHALLA